MKKEDIMFKKLGLTRHDAENKIKDIPDVLIFSFPFFKNICRKKKINIIIPPNTKYIWVLIQNIAIVEIKIKKFLVLIFSCSKRVKIQIIAPQSR